MFEEDYQNQNNRYTGVYYFDSLITDIEGSYEIYKELRDTFMGSQDIVTDVEKYFQRRIGASNMTEYNNQFDGLLEFITYLHEKALEIEDYEFCGALVKVRLYAIWKDGELQREFNENYSYENEEN